MYLQNTNENKIMTNQNHKQSSLLTYVGSFIQKQNNQLREEEKDLDLTTIQTFDRNSVIIKTDESELTDIDLTSDPVIEIREGGKQTYKQPFYLRQYQPPTPEPVDIQVQEVLLKPRIQHPPVHVYIKPRDEQRTPSPIVIQSSPPQPTISSSNEPIVYNKYIPVDSKPLPQQIVVHRYPELPLKPRPIVVDQWLPNKPPPKRVIYRRVNHDELVQKETKRPHNRYIEYKKPHMRIEVEITCLPIIKMNPKDYLTQSSRLNHLQSPDHVRWRI